MSALAVACLLFAAVPAPASAASARVLTLEEALHLARERQPSLRQARAGTEAAQARADEFRAPLLPQVFASLGYSRTTANVIYRPGPTASVSPTTGSTASDFATYNSFSGALTLNQLIYDFGQTSGRWHAQEAQANAVADSERATVLQALLNVRGSYFDARANKALAGVARETLDNLRKHQSQIEEFVKAGTRPEIDLVQARTDTANAVVTVINAENAYESSKAQLNQAMGSPGPTDYDVADEQLSAVQGEDAAVDALLDESLRVRPEVASLLAQLNAQQEVLRSVEGQYGPSIGANAGISQGGTALDHLNWNASAGVSLSWGLFQGGLTNATVREARSSEAALRAQLDGLRLQIRLEVEQVRLAVRATKAALGASREALLNSRERLNLAEQRYQQGLGSIIELGDAQVAVTSASAQVVQADFRLATARAQLLKALGRP